MALYQVTINFRGLRAGEIVEIINRSDVPETYYERKYLVPYGPQDTENDKQVDEPEYKTNKVTSTDPTIMD